MAKTTAHTTKMRTAALRVSRLHFVYAGLLALQVIIYDAWKLIVPSIVLKRWVIASVLLSVNLVVWFLLRTKQMGLGAIKALLWLLILTDIGVATYSVYIQRGMASRAVILYAIPLLVSAVLMSRAAIFATAALSVAAYTTAAITYFVVNFNEGYKVELYGEIGFYSAVLFLLAGLLWIFVREKKT